MKRNDAEQIGDMIRKFFRLNGLESPLNEYRLVRAWKDVVHLTSSVLRQELMMGRDLLVSNLNMQVGAQVIVNIIFR